MIRHAILLLALLAVPAHADERGDRIARAERLTPQALAPLITGGGLQTRFAPGVAPLLDPMAPVQWSPDSRRFTYDIGSPSGPRRIEIDTRTLARRDLGPTPLTAAKTETRSPDGVYEAFTRGDDLYVRGPSGERRLSTDGEPWRSFAGAQARSNPVLPATEAPPQVRWIAGGPWFLIERWDHRAVGEFTLVDALAEPRPTVRIQKMALPGDAAEPIPEVWLFNAKDGRSRLIAAEGWSYLGNMDQGQSGLFPSADGRTLYFTRIARGHEKVRLEALDIESGAVRTLFEEQGQPWFGVRHMDLFELPDGFLWKSDRDGFHHYYRYDRSGRLIGQVTRGPFSMDRVLHVDPRSGALLGLAFVDGAPRLVSSSLEDGEARLIDKADAHAPVVSPDGRWIIDTISAPNKPPRMVLRDRTGREVLQLEAFDDAGLRRHGVRDPEPFTMLAADGRTRLHGVVWTPPNLDPAKRYPVIAQVYPGPAYETVPVGYVPAHPNAALAELGFVVVAVGQRGGTGIRGKEDQSWSRRSGDIVSYGLADQRFVLEQLAQARPYMDMDRVGITGRSGGGFMAASAILHDPGFWKAAVATAGNVDNNIYELNSSEFLWGAPGPEGYARTDDKAANLKGALLLIHGDQDDDVNIAHTLRLARALIEAGKRFDLVVLPGEGHNRYSPAADRYVRLRTWDHFLTHLAGLPASGADLEPRP